LVVLERGLAKPLIFFYIPIDDGQGVLLNYFFESNKFLIEL